MSNLRLTWGTKFLFFNIIESQKKDFIINKILYINNDLYIYFKVLV